MTPRAGVPPLPGRDAELERLRRAWCRAQHGHRQVVLLSGEPGVGKTSLAAGMAHEAEAGGATVLTAGAEERGGAPYQPLADALRAAMGSAAAAFLDRGTQLGFVLPELGLSSPVSPAPLLREPGTDREELFDAVGDLVVELAEPAPLVLVLDDLQWADRSTMLLLDRVIDSTRRSPVLVVGCYSGAVDRVHPLTVLLDALRDDQDCTSICLEELAPEVVAAMVPDDALAEALARRSEGNPLYVEVLLRELRDVGHLQANGTLHPAADLDADLLPRSTDDLVDRRVARLRPAVRRLLGVAAVVGRPVDLALVSATGEVRSERVQAAAAEAVACGLVEPVEGHDETYRFAHAVSRRAVYHRLSPGARVRLHRRVGEALAAAAGGADADVGAVAEIAAHLCAAAPVGRSEVAARYAARAGDQAMAVLAYEVAADHYGRALALLEHATAASWVARGNLLLSLGEAQRQALEPARARQAFLEAVDDARAHGQTELVERLEDALETVGPDAAMAPPDAGPPADNRAIDLASRRGDHVAVGALLRARHVRTWGPEDIDERLRAADDVVALASESGDAELAVQAHGWRLLDLLELGRLAEADRDVAAHAALAQALGHPAPARDAALFTAMRALLEGRADDARAANAEVLARGGQAGDPQAAGVHLRQRYWLDLEWGGEAEHATLLRACRRMAAGADRAGGWRAAVALLLARTGNVGAAAIELARVSRHDVTARPHGPAWMATASCVAESAWLLADPRWTPLLAPALHPFAGRLVVLEHGAACLGSVARLQGLLSASARRWTEAGRCFEEALEVHRGLGALPLVARTSYEWGATLLRRGRRGDAIRAAASLRGAAELGAELGMRQLAYDARTRLQSA